MPGVYPLWNDNEIDLLKKLVGNTALLADGEAGDVASILGTAGQITVSNPTGVVTLSLPADLTGITSINSVAVGNWVVGPASATDNAAARFDTTTGKLVQNSGLLIGDVAANSVTISGIDANTDLTLRGGLAGATISLGRAATGAIAITAQGTNQSITLTPSGSGMVVLTGGIIGTTSATNVNFRYNSNNVFQINSVTQASMLGTNTLRFGATAMATIGVSADTTGGVFTFIAPSAGSFSFNKLISSYNGVATAGWGVQVIQANGTIAATTNARSAAVATYTVGAADGTFVVSGNILVTTSTTFSFSLDCSYTDESNVARVLVLPLAQLAGTFVVTGLATNATGAGPYESASLTIRCKASTSITIRPSAGGTYTGVVYNVNASIRQIA